MSGHLENASSMHQNQYFLAELVVMVVLRLLFPQMQQLVTKKCCTCTHVWF